jgi:hypothetical protein
MGRSLNLVLGALATALVAVGVAAQTGTVRVPHLSALRSTAVTHQSPTPTPAVVEPAVLPTTRPATPQSQPQQQQPPPPPPANNGGEGDDEDGR